MSVELIQEKCGIVGRGRELRTALAILNSGRHLLLEGPVGVGKTTVALCVCGHLGRGIMRVDGDDRYSESKLTGWFDPPLVLRAGLRRGVVLRRAAGAAMREGRVLFINELNRMPETVQNVLLPALDEGLLQVPHIGEVRAAPGSRWSPRRTRWSTSPPATSRRRCATASSTSRSTTRRRPRRRRSSPPDRQRRRRVAPHGGACHPGTRLHPRFRGAPRCVARSRPCVAEELGRPTAGAG